MSERRSVTREDILHALYSCGYPDASPKAAERIFDSLPAMFRTVSEPRTAAGPQTDQGKWLIAHQGLVNIGKWDGSMRGDEIDLRACVVTIEAEARAAALDEARAAATHVVDSWTPEAGELTDCVDAAIDALRERDMSGPPDPTYDPFCDDCDGLRERS